MTNSRKPQSEKLATGGGRGTTAVKGLAFRDHRSNYSKHHIVETSLHVLLYLSETG